MFHGARILVAPLDWGLGHAARCVPIVQQLLELGAVPVIGADKGPSALLHEEFPELDFVQIPGMEVRYSRNGSQAWAMARQLPAMLRQVRQEHAWLQANLDRLQLDAVISDQRFGLYAPALPSVLVTHQVFPFTPLGQGTARRINRKHIQRFDRCWIADHAEAPGLAGELSHGMDLPQNAHYIGPLSRFAGTPPHSNQQPIRVAAVISGPEPQRSLLEAQVLQQLQAIEGPHLLVTGKPGTEVRHAGQVRIEGHLPTEALRNALARAELIVGRTGYSTLMDLAAIGRGALLIPTPGQPEQEYLGRLHGHGGRHVVQAQRQLDLATALKDPPERHAPCKTSGALSVAMNDLAGLIMRPRNHILPSP